MCIADFSAIEQISTVFLISYDNRHTNFEMLTNYPV